MEIHNKTILRFNWSTQMAHTPTSKPEIGSIVRKQFCVALHAFRCLNKHLTGAPSSYTPLLVLGPAPHDPRVHKPTIRETRMTQSYTLIWCVFPPLPPAIVSRHQNQRRRYLPRCLDMRRDPLHHELAYWVPREPS